MNDALKPKATQGAGRFLPLVRMEIKPHLDSLTTQLEVAQEQLAEARTAKERAEADDRFLKYTRALVSLKTTAFVASVQAEAIALAAVVGQVPRGKNLRDNEDDSAEFLKRMRDKTKAPIG